MASIRLFGRGKSGSAAARQGAGGATAVDAETIAAVLADLSTAAVSTTWRCRHASGVSIGEGAVDFGAHRSRATIIRGKRTYEYVRNGSSVFRALVPDEGEPAAAQAEPEPEDEDESQSEEAAALAEDDDGEPAHGEDAEPGEAGGDEAGMRADEDDCEEEEDDDEPEASDLSGDDEGEDGGEAEEAEGAEDGDGEGRESGEPDAFDADAGDVAEKDADARDWQTFSENDVCGPHSYAEPAVLAQAVRRAGLVQARKAEEFDGVMLAAYCVTAKPKPADPDRLLARLARQLRDHGANTVVVTAFVDESAKDTGSGGDGAEGGGGSGARIVRLRVELPHWTPADDPTADHSVSVDLFELGDPVEIEVPDRDGATRRTARTCADLSLF
jgi:hypothetical protein